MKAKSKLLLIAIAAILTTVLTQPTLAYYTTIGKATNVVTSGGIQLKIHEKTANGDPLPGRGCLHHPRRYRFQAGQGPPGRQDPRA